MSEKTACIKTDDVIRSLENHEFFTGMGMPVHMSGRYCMYRKSTTLTTSQGRLVIRFERMELNDEKMLDKYDQLYHNTIRLNNTIISTSSSHTLTPEHMKSIIRDAITNFHITEILFG